MTETIKTHSQGESIPLDISESKVDTQPRKLRLGRRLLLRILDSKLVDRVIYGAPIGLREDDEKVNDHSPLESYPVIHPDSPAIEETREQKKKRVIAERAERRRGRSPRQAARDRRSSARSRGKNSGVSESQPPMHVFDDAALEAAVAKYQDEYSTWFKKVGTRVSDYPYPDPGAPSISIASSEESLTWNSDKAIQEWKALWAARSEEYDGRLKNTIYLDPPEDEIDAVTSEIIKTAESRGLSVSLTRYDQIHRYPEVYRDKGITDVPRMVLWVSDRDKERLRRIVEYYELLHKSSLNARFSYE
jgi:hypothetical protein